MAIELTQAVNYRTFVFDCDGVILDLNRVKTDAFYQTALPYGEHAAKALVRYHVRNGGVSRYKKFAYFCENIVPDREGPGLEALLDAYAEYVRVGLKSCEVAHGIHELRSRTRDARWLIVSGGDERELQEVFVHRGLAPLFDGGIFGSPDSKDEILSRELGSGAITRPAVLLGDSKYDYQAATRAGLDFLFVSKWSEVVDWQEWTRSEDISTLETVYSLLWEL